MSSEGITLRQTQQYNINNLDSPSAYDGSPSTSARIPRPPRIPHRSSSRRSGMSSRWPLGREQTLICALAFSVLWINCRYTLRIVPDPYNPFTATTNPAAFLPRYSNAKGTDRLTPAGLASLIDMDDDLVSHAVAIEQAFEFANVSTGNALGIAEGSKKGESAAMNSFDAYYRHHKDKVPDSVHDHTMSYPAWVHQTTLVIPHEYTQAPSAPKAPDDEPTKPPLTADISLQDAPSDQEANERLCASLQFALKGSVGSVVLDAGWWAVGDMLKPNPTMFPPSSTNKRSLFQLLLNRCPGMKVSPPTATATPMVLPWVSPLIPESDARWRVGALKGYFLHGGEQLPSQEGTAAGDEKIFKAKRFRWYRKGVVRSGAAVGSTNKRQYEDYVIEGSLIDFTNPAAVRWFIMDETHGLYALFAAYDDVAGVRCGGVDILLKDHGSNPHINGRLYAKSGAINPQDYSRAYYSEIYHGGHNIISKLKKIAENEARDNAGSGGGVIAFDLKREFVMMARTVDSHNNKHHFYRYSLPDTTSMGFVGDHALTYSDLRASALNIIHSTYHCFPNMGSIVGRKGEGFSAALRGAAADKGPVYHPPTTPLQGHDHTFKKVEEATAAFDVAESWETLWKFVTSSCPAAASTTSNNHQISAAVEAGITQRWGSFTSLMPIMYISPETVRLVDPEELSTTAAQHNALAPYFAANSKRTQLFDYAALHVQTDANSAFKYYHNAHGNPYCAVRYMPSFYHRMFNVDTLATLNTSVRDAASYSEGYGVAVKQYARSRTVSRNDLPHVLFQPPMSDYQFAIGPDMLVVPSLLPPSPPSDAPDAKGDIGRRVSFPLPQGSPGLDLRSCHTSSLVDDGGLGGLESMSIVSSPKGGRVVIVNPPVGVEGGGENKPANAGGGAPGTTLMREVVDSSMWVNADELYRGDAPVGNTRNGVYSGLTAVLPTSTITAPNDKVDAVLTRRGSLIPLLQPHPTAPSKEVVVFGSDIPIFCDGGVPPQSAMGVTNVTARLAELLTNYYSYNPSYEALSAKKATAETATQATILSPQDYAVDRVGAGARYKSSLPFSYTHWVGAKMVINAVLLAPSRERVLVARYRPTSTDLPLEKRKMRFSASEAAVSVVLPPTGVVQDSDDTKKAKQECSCQTLPLASTDAVPATIPKPVLVPCDAVPSPEKVYTGGLNSRHKPITASSVSGGGVACAVETVKGGWRRIVLQGSALQWWSCACNV